MIAFDPWLAAFVTVGPASAIAGFLIRPLIASGKSSPPPFTFTDEQKKELAMAVYAEVQPALDALAQATADLPGKVAAAVSAGSAEAATDKADTIAAVNSTVGAATAAMEAVGAPVEEPAADPSQG